MRIRQRLQQRCVIDGEDRGVRAHAQRQCQQNRERQPRILQQHADAEAKVAEQILHECTSHTASSDTPQSQKCDTQRNVFQFRAITGSSRFVTFHNVTHSSISEFAEQSAFQRGEVLLSTRPKRREKDDGIHSIQQFQTPRAEQTQLS